MASFPVNLIDDSKTPVEKETDFTVYLRAPKARDKQQIIEAYARSVELHDRWTFPPTNYDTYLCQQYRYFVCIKENNAIAGTFHLSEIVRGWFQSAYLGYEAFTPFNGNGYMKQGLLLLLNIAFNELKLHRLEANIQPENHASLALVRKAGFVREGFSKRYLLVGGKEWKDHERWAIVNPNWSN